MLLGEGLSPLARRHPSPRVATVDRPGTIAARAASPRVRRRLVQWSWDYRRSRGVTPAESTIVSWYLGLSPLARRHRVVIHPRADLIGTIAARAASPRGCNAIRRLLEDYRRSRGVTGLLQVKSVGLRGLSPLARRHPTTCTAGYSRTGTIAARAASPAAQTPARPESRDYRRSRGVTERPPLPGLRPMGLSPLARRHPDETYDRLLRSRTIAARAASPHNVDSGAVLVRDYRRSRGVTSHQLLSRSLLQGLSPLARRHLAASLRGTTMPGTIAARAASPFAKSLQPSRSRDYRRSRGVTCSCVADRPRPRGLSPLARRHRPERGFWISCARTIAARAASPS